MTYARLNEDGTLDILRRVPYVSNASAATMAAYATAHGYKTLIYTASPGLGATSSWQDTGEEIRQVWTTPSVETAREYAMQQVQQWRNAAMGETCALETMLGWPLEYTPEAVTLAQGTLILMLTGLCETTSWTDAGNTRHEGLGAAEMKVIASTLAQHIRGIQDKADALRARISTATVEDLPGILAEV